MGDDADDREAWPERDRLLATLRDGLGVRGIPRAEIENSWRRCSMTGVSPSTVDIPYSADFPQDNRLRRAAGPVLRRLAERLEGSPATILLADGGGRIIARHTGRGELEARLDAAQVAPGFQYAEDHSGTNGIGTALEERKLFSVRGGEHFRESLQSLACVGKPIVHPVRRGIEGVLDITSSLQDANDMMAPLVEAAVREIEQRLYEMSSRGERALLAEFLRTSRRRSTPVITIGSDLVMATPAAARMLQPADQTLLWEWACEKLDGRNECLGEVRLAEGHLVLVKAHRLDDDGGATGVVLELQDRSERATRPAGRGGQGPTAPGPAVTRVPGRSDAARLLESELDHAADVGEPTLIGGDAGVGKMFVARLLHERWNPAGGLVVEDLAIVEPGEMLMRLRALRDPLTDGATVLVRHLQAFTPEALPVLGALVEFAREGGMRLMATGPDGDGGASALAPTYFRSRITVPPLAARPEDIEDIVREVLRLRADGRAPQRLQSTALRSLGQRTLPGNVRELVSILHVASARALGGDIGIQHLPAEYQEVTSARARTALERAEIDALLTALRESNGNKSFAAEKLGIARSTLYRKVREYGIDTERFLAT